MEDMTEKERVEWVNTFESGKRWLNAIRTEGIDSEHTLRGYSRALLRFSKWISKTPDELLELEPQTVKDKITQFCLWLKDEKELTKTTIATKYQAPLKSFFEHNGVYLRLKTMKHVSTVIEGHTVEEIKTLLQIADLREKVLILTLKDCGLSRQDVVTLRLKDVKGLMEGEKFIPIKIVRQKTLTKHVTFLGEESTDILRTYLETRERKGETLTPETPLLISTRGDIMTPQTLTQIFVRLSKKSGIQTSPHRYRKYFESHAGLSAPSLLVKSWMGHSIGVESSYFLPSTEEQLEKYKEAYNELRIHKREPSELEQRKQRLADIIRLKDLDEETIKLLELKIQRAETTEELDRITEEIRRPKLEPFKSYRHEDEDCQKIISESELQEWLNKGFHFVSVLPSGKILISNE